LERLGGGGPRIVEDERSRAGLQESALVEKTVGRAAFPEPIAAPGPGAGQLQGGAGEVAEANVHPEIGAGTHRDAIDEGEIAGVVDAGIQQPRRSAPSAHGSRPQIDELAVARDQLATAPGEADGQGPGSALLKVKDAPRQRQGAQRHVEVEGDTASADHGVVGVADRRARPRGQRRPRGQTRTIDTLARRERPRRGGIKTSIVDV
jgi:hypothetical protein